MKTKKHYSINVKRTTIEYINVEVFADDLEELYDKVEENDYEFDFDTINSQEFELVNYELVDPIQGKYDANH